MVAQEFAVTWPERVERLALVCTSPGGDFASYPLHTLADMPPEEAKALAPKLLDGRFTPEYLAEHDDARALVDMITACRARQSSDEVKRGEQAQLDARSRLNVLDRLGNITCPTLVACGKYDHIAPPENSEKIAELHPARRPALLRGRPHLLPAGPAGDPRRDGVPRRRLSQSSHAGHIDAVEHVG